MSNYLRKAPPHHWIAAVCDMNFDQDVHRELLRWLIRQKSCEYAVALAAYWYLGPRWDAQYVDKNGTVSPEEKITYDILREIECRYEGGYYRKGELGFDPSNDVFHCEAGKPGHDWTADYVDRPQARLIPALMLAPVSGKQIHSSDPELRTWIEGLPESVWNAADRACNSRTGTAIIVLSLIWNSFTRQSPSLKTL